jgi:hypothetical protein
MTYKMEVGGFFLVSEFKGEFGGQKFFGRGIDGYDLAKKKFVSVWVDSMVSGMIITEGTYDKEKKTMTMTGEGPGQEGKPTKYKMVTDHKEKDFKRYTIYTQDKDGKDESMMVITYKRKK